MLSLLVFVVLNFYQIFLLQISLHGVIAQHGSTIILKWLAVYVTIKEV